MIKHNLEIDKAWYCIGYKNIHQEEELFTDNTESFDLAYNLGMDLQKQGLKDIKLYVSWELSCLLHEY